MIDKLMRFRKQESQKLKDNSKLNVGDVTTVNLTMLKGGLQSNVVPAELSATFDIRLAIDVDHDAFDKQVRLISEFCGINEIMVEIVILDLR